MIQRHGAAFRGYGKAANASWTLNFRALTHERRQTPLVIAGRLQKEPGARADTLPSSCRRGPGERENAWRCFWHVVLSDQQNEHTFLHTKIQRDDPRRPHHHHIIIIIVCCQFGILLPNILWYINHQVTPTGNKLESSYQTTDRINIF